MITLTRSITLAGGWDGAATGPLNIDPERYPTVLDGERRRRVVYVDEEVAVTLDGLVIARGNATGLTLDRCPGYASSPGIRPDGCGGGVLAAPLSQVIIRRSVITDNVAAVTTQGYPTGTIGYGGGIALVDVAGVRVENSLIISNAASLAANGMGGGLYIEALGGADIQVVANRILSNTATTRSVASWGGGIALDNAATVSKNQVAYNQAPAGAGLYTWYDALYGESLIVDNLFTGNRGGNAVYLGHSAARLEGNRILRNATGTGLFIAYGEDIAPVVVNNIIARSGERAVVASGSDRNPLTASLVHNTLVGEGRGEGIYVGGYAGSVVTLTVTNTIVTGLAWASPPQSPPALPSWLTTFSSGTTTMTASGARIQWTATRGFSTPRRGTTACSGAPRPSTPGWTRA
ncbi:MAG: right-handed parallel beta-helix repeat-containing protein [Ardenticatenia bacterium]|nr:right-handed parallel beta-helix repeat-containing protein [Ardenticatenia bacterium]